MTSRFRQLDAQRLTKPIRERLDTSLLAHPKPSASVKQQPKDGRLVESPYQYRKTKREIWLSQDRCCAKCFRFAPSPAFGHRHHLGGRGIGGGKRDDRKTEFWCIDCHKSEDPKLHFGEKIA